MPRINLLPWREAERKRKRQEFILSIGAAIATAALVTLIGRWQMSAAIEHQDERNRIISDEIALLDKQIQEILGLEKQKQAPSNTELKIYSNRSHWTCIQTGWEEVADFALDGFAKGRRL